MCFSATASFGAAIVLSATGIITITKASEPAQRAFAAIPLLFGIQQAGEGFVWLTAAGGQEVQQAAVYFFIFFSHILWPFWVPFSVLLFEKAVKRKHILFAIFIAALVLAAAEVYYVSAYGADAVINGHHVQYTVHFPRLFIQVSNVLYGLVTLLPCFVSSYKKMRLFSGVLMLSVIIAQLFYTQWRISVWCFFAAILSSVILYIINAQPKKEPAAITVAAT